MAAVPPTFDTILEDIIGIAMASAREAFMDTHGFDEIDTLMDATDGDIDNVVNTINRSRPRGNARPARIPLAKTRNLKALRLWAVWRTRMGLDIEAESFTDEELDTYLERLKFERDLDVNAPSPPKLPEKLTSFGKWKGFFDLFDAHCKVVRGTANIPLSYIYRDHFEVKDALRGLEYDTSDMFFMNCVLFEESTGNLASEIKQDMARVWDILLPLVYDTPAWAYVKQCSKKKDSRTAIKLLQSRGEGQSASASKKAHAENMIRTAHFNGKSKRYSLDKYINKLQDAFTELEAEGEHRTEAYKVTALLAGLNADRLKTAKETILLNPTLRNSFEEAYSALKTSEQMHAAHSDTGDDRRISETGRAGAQQTRTHFKRRKTSGYIPAKEWKEMSSDQRTAILEKRRTSKTAAANQGETKRRKLSEATTAMGRMELDIPMDPAHPERTVYEFQAHKPVASPPMVTHIAGPQFGRQAHAVQTATHSE